MIKRTWDNLGQKLGTRGRVGLAVGAVIILLATALAGYLLLRSDYQVLFADLTPQDAAAMTAELDRLKIPYALGDQGNNVASILVEKSEVHRTRIKLMGKEIPLHGAVGFELFNNSDFGMTEFAQKINYQRALQGELTRTIMSLAEIRDARVLLALPEQGLFKQATSKPKASVTLTLKQGQGLRSEQVTGIQRLVSAAVPGIATQDVTIVDQSGVALTRVAADGDGEFGSGSSRLDLKKDTEALLSRKATEVLDRALGQGQALASVDVTLNMDRVQSSTDEVVGAPSRPGAAPTGVVVRERETTREVGSPLRTHNTTEVNAGPLGGSNQREIEYAVGHRIEQVTVQPGSIRRVQVAVVVKKPLNQEQQEHLRQVVAASVGASTERGDTVIVQTLESLTVSRGNSFDPNRLRSMESAAVDGTDGAINADAPITSDSRSPRGSADAPWSGVSWAVDLGMLVLLVLVVVGSLLRGRRLLGGSAATSTADLTDVQRQIVLAQVQAWMRDSQQEVTASTVPAAGVTPSGVS